MHLDYSGICLDRLLPPALSLDRLRITGLDASRCSEKEITDFQSLLELGADIVYGIAKLKMRTRADTTAMPGPILGNPRGSGKDTATLVLLP